MKTDATDVTSPPPDRPPDRTWLADRRWRGGTVVDESDRSLVFGLLFAIVWNLFAWWVFIGSSRDRGIGNAIYFVALFPGIGLLLAIACMVMVVRRLKFGRSILELETFPGQIGGYFAGTIRTSTTLVAPEGVRLSLQCVDQVTTGRGKNRSMHEHVRWEEDQALEGRLPAAGWQTSIPVSFAIPGNAPPSGGQGDSVVLWRLRAYASMPGADYSATFEVPVFAVEVPVAPPKTEAIAAKFRGAAPPLMQRASEAGIQFNKDAAGRLRLHFSAARNPGGAALFTVFALLFCAIGIGARYMDGSILFPIVFCFGGSLMMLGAASAWFLTRTVHVRQDGVEVRWRLLVLGGTKTIPRDSIAQVGYRMNASAGNKTYFMLLLQLTDGSQRTLGAGVKMSDAKWIADEIAAALGVPAIADLEFKMGP